MYKIGDKVMHQQEGACYIKEIVSMKMSNEAKDYYLLVPVLNAKASIYVSVDSSKQKNIRYVIELNELKTAQEELKEHPIEWIENPKQRMGLLGDNIKSFNFRESLLTFACLKRQNEEKKLSAKDGAMLMVVQKQIFSELSILLNIAYETIAADPEKYVFA